MLNASKSFHISQLMNELNTKIMDKKTLLEASESYEKFKENFPNYMKEKRKAYYQKNKEKIKAYQKANKEKIKAYHKAYQKANKEKIKAYDRAYYQANREKKFLRVKNHVINLFNNEANHYLGAFTMYFNSYEYNFYHAYRELIKSLKSEGVETDNYLTEKPQRLDISKIKNKPTQ